MNVTASKWTKLITGAIKFLPEAQWVGVVVELLTHLASSMGATSVDSKEALKHIESLHMNLAQLTAAHTSLSQQINAQFSSQAGILALQSERLEAVGTGLHSTKLAVDSIEGRLSTLEARASRLFYLLAVLFLLMVVSLILLAILLLRLHSAH